VGVVGLLLAVGIAVALPYGIPRGLPQGWTGRERPKPRPYYPSLRIAKGLVDAPVRVADDGLYVVDFAPWFDGEPVLLRSRGGRVESLAEDLSTRSVEVPGLDHVREWLHVGGDDVHALALGSAHDPGVPQAVQALSHDGEVLWAWDPGRESLMESALLYDPGSHAPAGVCVAAWNGDEGTVTGIDLAGRERWFFSAGDGLAPLEPSTHPALPEVLLLGEGGTVRVFHLAAPGRPPVERTSIGGVARLSESGARGWVRFRHPRLLPADDATACWVARSDGYGFLAEHAVQFVEADGRMRWRAVPADALAFQGVSRLDAGDGRRLVVVTTRGGEILLLDERGGLRGRTRVPEAKPDSVRAARAGRMGRGFAMAAQSGDTTWLWRLHPEALAP
jgi:hypothetical protein